MYLSAKELKTNMYAHVIEQITEGDDSVVEQAIDAAIEEAKSYLAQRYDIEKVFTTEGKGRNALVLENVKVIVIWRIITICNAETIYEMWKERYDRVIDYFKSVAKGVTTPSLPLIKDSQGNVTIQAKFGSNPKFNHEL
ncbi:MAG: phage protein Gp36 family protein [Muribaculaceae bacterium]